MAFVPFSFTVGSVEVQGEVERLSLGFQKQLNSLIPPVGQPRRNNMQADGLIENHVLSNSLRSLKVKKGSKWQKVDIEKGKEEGAPLEQLPEIDDPHYITFVGDEIMREVCRVNFFLYLHPRYAQVFRDYEPNEAEKVKLDPTPSPEDTSTSTA